MINKNINISDLVLANSSIDESQQKEIIKFLFSRFVKVKKDLLFVEKGSIRTVHDKSSFNTVVKYIVKRDFKDAKVLIYDEETKKYNWEINIVDIYNQISTFNQCTIVRYKSNLFLEEPTSDINLDTETITIIPNKIHMKKPKCDFPIELKKTIVDDYKKHFKKFDELLKLIIDMRFAQNKKASFLHIKVKSDWGKSFLASLFKEIDVGFEADYKNILSTSTNDIHPVQIRNSFVLMIDEFNKFAADMKKLSHDISIAPKFGFAERVELYLKILFSHEDSESFTGAVSPQIVNRIMVFYIPDNEVVKITERKVFIENSKTYHLVLQEYIYSSLKQQIKRYLDLGETEAYRVADLEVRKAYEKYKMINAEDINKVMVEVINDGIGEISNSNYDDLNQSYKGIYWNIIKLSENKYQGKLFIKQPSKVFETIVRNSVTDSEYKKMKYVLPNIINSLDVVGDYRKNKYKIDEDRKFKGVILDIRDDDDKKIPYEETDKDDNPVKNGYLTLHTEDKEPFLKDLYQ